MKERRFVGRKIEETRERFKVKKLVIYRKNKRYS